MKSELLIVIQHIMRKTILKMLSRLLKRNIINMTI